jgi:hypothetical protein
VCFGVLQVSRNVHASVSPGVVGTRRILPADPYFTLYRPSRNMDQPEWVSAIEVVEGRGLGS